MTLPLRYFPITVFSSLPTWSLCDGRNIIIVIIFNSLWFIKKKTISVQRLETYLLILLWQVSQLVFLHQNWELPFLLLNVQWRLIGNYYVKNCNIKLASCLLPKNIHVNQIKKLSFSTIIPYHTFLNFLIIFLFYQDPSSGKFRLYVP